MTRQVFRIFCILAICSFVIAALPYNANAKEAETAIDSRVYVFDEKSGYEISSSEPVQNVNAVSGFSISGNVVKNTQKDNIPAFEVENGSVLSFSYTYNNSLINATGTDEHIVSDSQKSVDGIELDDKIQMGAVILQTSLDGQKWTVNYKQTDIFEDNAVQNQPFYETNDIQLLNGCYYRFIVAYKTEKEVESSKILWIDKKNYEYKKYAEVYEFYAKYKDPEDSVPSDNERLFTLGEVVNTGTDNGYSGLDPLNGKDPHYGWKLGDFKIGGFTDKTDDNIFLKNVGDKITLWFELKQDIDRLNGNEKLSIAADEDGYDQYFQTKPTDMGRGTLIIRYTDYMGVKHDPIIYTNYLEAISSASADVKVQVFEEGDYEVALDYKIKSDDFIDSYEDYRIFFTFKIRNGNCMVFPYDAVNRNQELKNSSVSENGFYLDLAKSRYLKINVEMVRWTKGVDGYTKDVRYNRPAKDGDEYTEEGIYTIEVSNPTTEKNTVKKIYVGSDSVIIASMNPKNDSYSINDIAELVEQGAEIQSDGTIIPPKPPETEPPVTETETVTEVFEAPTETSAETVDDTSAISNTEVSEEAVPASAEVTEKSGSSFTWVIIVIVVVVGVLIYILKNKKNDMEDTRK